MERTKFNKKIIEIPDAINCGNIYEFTQIPNSLIRNPEISGKAKSLLCLLLSNREGWHSCLEGVKVFMKERGDAIQTGLQELEKFGYLLRIKYRNKKTKKWVGSFWAYTNIPGNFNIEPHLDLLNSKGLEIIKPTTGFSLSGKSTTWKPTTWKSGINNTNNKNTNNKNTKSSYDFGNITPSQFEKFWRIYPKKVDKGKALSKWNSICSKKAKDRPKWRDIKKAIREQKKTERWQDPQFIPVPTTWLNQSRWLDDPAEMKVFKRNSNPKNNTVGYRSGEYKTRKPDEII